MASEASLFFSYFAEGLEYSIIVGNNRNYLKWLSKWLVPVTQQSSSWSRCYQATVNGWSSYTFHSCCDGLGPTVTIIRVGKYIFGGYTSLSWSKWLDLLDFLAFSLSPTKETWASHCIVATWAYLGKIELTSLIFLPLFFCSLHCVFPIRLQLWVSLRFSSISVLDG